VSRKTQPDVSSMTLAELGKTEPGALVQVSLGMGARLVLRRTRDGRWVPVHGACLPTWAVAELAGRSLSARPASTTE
jgi:hypothetical protein